MFSICWYPACLHSTSSNTLICICVCFGGGLPAFPQTSQYPVILSLENHCSVEQQEVMARHMSSILGSALITSPLSDGMPTNFPSPEVSIRFTSFIRIVKAEPIIGDKWCVCVCACTVPQELKGKFLIKGKRLNKLEDTFAEAAADDNDVTEEEESNDEDAQKEKSTKVVEPMKISTLPHT